MPAGAYLPKVYYFPIDRHLLMRDYCTNSSMLDALDSLMCDKRVTANIDTIIIYGACSPVGSEVYNYQLAMRRAQAMRTYLRWKHLDVAGRLPIKMHSLGIDHAGYRALKSSGLKLTERQIWNLLQYTSIRLRMKDGSYIHPGAESPMQAIVEENRVEVIKQMIRDTVHVYVSDTVYTRNVVYINKGDTVFSESGDAPARRMPQISIKTNLLYDALLLPNLTIEAWLGRNWSVAAEGNISWWGGEVSPTSRRHRVRAGALELRRWFFSSGPFSGHAIGLYGGYLDYDLRLWARNENDAGQLSYASLSAGISYAYSFRISRQLNMELGVAAGYVRGDYYDYNYCLKDSAWEPLDRKSYKTRSYWGPARIGVSLVWVPGRRNTAAGKNKHE